MTSSPFYTDRFGDRVLKNGTMAPDATTPTRLIAEQYLSGQGFPDDQIAELRMHHQVYESALVEAHIGLLAAKEV